MNKCSSFAEITSSLRGPGHILETVCRMGQVEFGSAFIDEQSKEELIRLASIITDFVLNGANPLLIKKGCYVRECKLGQWNLRLLRSTGMLANRFCVSVFFRECQRDFGFVPGLWGAKIHDSEQGQRELVHRKVEKISMENMANRSSLAARSAQITRTINTHGELIEVLFKEVNNHFGPSFLESTPKMDLLDKLSEISDFLVDSLLDTEISNREITFQNFKIGEGNILIELERGVDFATISFGESTLRIRLSLSDRAFDFSEYQTLTIEECKKKYPSAPRAKY